MCSNIKSFLFCLQFSSNTVNTFESTVRVQFGLLLRRPRKRWRSIVMSMSVCVGLCLCLSVCLPASISSEPHARSLPNFYACCLWLWLGPPPAGWRNSKGKRQFWEFSPLAMHCNALAANNIMQQKRSFRLHWGRWCECTDSAGELPGFYWKIYFKKEKKSFFQTQCSEQHHWP